MSEEDGKRIPPIVIAVFAIEGTYLVLALVTGSWVSAAGSLLRGVGLALRKEWALFFMWLGAFYGFVIPLVVVVVPMVSNRDLTPIDAPVLLLRGLVPMAFSVLLAIVYTREPLFEWVGADRG